MDPTWKDTVSIANTHDGTSMDICGSRTCTKPSDDTRAFYETDTTLNWGTGFTDSDSDIGEHDFDITCKLDNPLYSISTTTTQRVEVLPCALL